MRVKYKEAKRKPISKSNTHTPKVPVVSPVDENQKENWPRAVVFAPRVNDFVKESINRLPRNARILDLGCGEGGNALLLAKNGFDVVAIDIKKPSITKLKASAAEEGLKIEAIAGDIETYLQNCKEFDVIFGINILQFINSKKVSSVIKNIKRKTVAGGLNIISSFIAKDKSQKSIVISKWWYLFYKNELAAAYKDQNILFYEEKIVSARGHDKKPTKNFIVKMISQKK